MIYRDRFNTLLHQEDHEEPRHDITDRIMISGLLVLFLAVWLTLCLQINGRCIWRQIDRFTGQRRQISAPRRFSPTRLPLGFAETMARMRINEGLDTAILATLPMFVYQSQNFRDGLTCAVCQIAFEEKDIARRLPNCGHSFHVDCINIWLREHSNCPVCRTGAAPEPPIWETEPEKPVVESAGTEQASVTISEPICPGIDDHFNSKQAQSSSSGVEPNLQNITDISSRNGEMDDRTSGGSESLSVAIEMPIRADGFSSPVETRHPCIPFPSDHSAESDDYNNC